MTYRFIDQHKGHWPVRLLCEALEVSPAGYYAWRGRPASARQRRRDALLVEVRAVHAEAKARYGSPRVHAELAARGRGRRVRPGLPGRASSCGGGSRLGRGSVRPRRRSSPAR